MAHAYVSWLFKWQQSFVYISMENCMEVFSHMELSDRSVIVVSRFSQAQIHKHVSITLRNRWHTYNVILVTSSLCGSLLPVKYRANRHTHTHTHIRKQARSPPCQTHTHTSSSSNYDQSSHATRHQRVLPRAPIASQHMTSRPSGDDVFHLRVVLVLDSSFEEVHETCVGRWVHITMKQSMIELWLWLCLI